MTEEKVACPYCGRMLTPYVPRSGDGSALRLRAHKNQAGNDCDGWGALVDRADVRDTSDTSDTILRPPKPPRAKPAPAPPRLTEADFQRHVLAAAKRLGWLTCHTYRTRTGKGAWRTSTTAVGFPDVVAVHPTAGRVIFLELKAEDGHPSAEQLTWITALQACPGVEAYIARPSDWPDLLDLLTEGVTDAPR